MTKAEFIERYGEEAYKKTLEQVRAYKKANKERMAEQRKAYYEANKEKEAEQARAYKKINKERLDEYQREYRKTKNGRAIYLLNNYKWMDRKSNRGECTLTVEWITENIFSGQVCHWCSESNWEKLGCDRINNDLPHTPENVVCSCEDCNKNRGRKTYDEYRRLLNMKIA